MYEAVAVVIYTVVADFNGLRVDAGIQVVAVVATISPPIGQGRIAGARYLADATCGGVCALFNEARTEAVVVPVNVAGHGSVAVLVQVVRWEVDSSWLSWRVRRADARAIRAAHGGVAAVRT